MKSVLENYKIIIVVVIILFLLFMYYNGKFRVTKKENKNKNKKNNKKTEKIPGVIQDLYDDVHPGMSEGNMTEKQFMEIAEPLGYNQADYVNIAQLYATQEQVTPGDYKKILEVV